MTTPAPARAAATAAPDGAGLIDLYRAVRARTERLCEPLTAEDCVVQSMPDASPVKWHLAHTTWFFETFVLAPHQPGYPAVPESVAGFLFNSYYNAIGLRWERPRRGLLTRPTLAEVHEYRAAVDGRMERLLDDAAAREAAAETLVLGLNHEEQHQELILTDVKHILAHNPLGPVYSPAAPDEGDSAAAGWATFQGGLVSIGHDGDGFAFDNEGPRHTVFLHGFQLATRPTTNGEYLAFMADGGYERPDWWLSDGWAARRAGGWIAPLYWDREGGGWVVRTLSGPRPPYPEQPVCHVSYYEADAFARWAGARLPTEAEWEHAASGPPAGHFLEGGRFHPSAGRSPDDRGPLAQLYGEVWQWTSSAYAADPGYRPAAGALGEYNGKFMCNQFVLRGASCVTPRRHARRTYRNFFPPDARWQFSGIRLAKDAS